MIDEAVKEDGEEMGTIDKAVRMPDKAAKVAKETLEAPRQYMVVTSEIAKMVEGGYDIVIAIDKATSEVCEAPSEAIDNHSKNSGDVT